jgi:hypothetical protein
MPADRSDSDFNFGTRESPANLPGERKYTLLGWKATFWVNASPSSIRATTVRLLARSWAFENSRALPVSCQNAQLQF